MPVLIGTKQDQDALDIVRTICPQAIDLSGQTSFSEIAALGRQAVLALGNDTGPMHLIVAAGTPSAVLFSSESDPALCAPRSESCMIIKTHDLNHLDISEVQRGLQAVCGRCFGSFKTIS